MITWVRPVIVILMTRGTNYLHDNAQISIPKRSKLGDHWWNKCGVRSNFLKHFAFWLLISTTFFLSPMLFHTPHSWKGDRPHCEGKAMCGTMWPAGGEILVVQVTELVIAFKVYTFVWNWWADKLLTEVMFGRRLCSFRDDAQSSSSWDYCSPPGEVGLISLSDCMYRNLCKGGVGAAKWDWPVKV